MQPHNDQLRALLVAQHVVCMLSNRRGTVASDGKAAAGAGLAKKFMRASCESTPIIKLCNLMLSQLICFLLEQTATPNIPILPAEVVISSL
jgi:hypothetical protein